MTTSINLLLSNFCKTKTYSSTVLYMQMQMQMHMQKRIKPHPEHCFCSPNDKSLITRVVPMISPHASRTNLTYVNWTTTPCTPCERKRINFCQSNQGILLCHILGRTQICTRIALLLTGQKNNKYMHSKVKVASRVTLKNSPHYNSHHPPWLLPHKTLT